MMTYDNADRRSTLTYPNDIVATYGYDDANRLTSLSYDLAQTNLGTLTYTYDAAGSRTSMGGTWARTGVPAPLPSATYDAANRLTDWDNTTFAYDLNGNLTSDGTTTHTWNARNQLTALSGGTTASFAYDAVGRRRTKSFSGVTTAYLYDGLDIAQEQIGGSASANYLLGLGIDERFARTDRTGTRWYLTDALQSPVALADATGALPTSYTYEPYGATTQTGTGSAKTARYTGREEDGTGLYYYRARYYDLRRQRFVSEDSWRFGGGDVNFYGYVGNAPTQFTDPSGHIGLAVAMAIGCALGAGSTMLPDVLGGRKINWPLAYAGCALGATGGLAAGVAAGGAGVGAGAGAAGIKIGIDAIQHVAEEHGAGIASPGKSVLIFTRTYLSCSEPRKASLQAHSGMGRTFNAS